MVIVTDDQGYGELSCHGNPVLKTPNLDRLHDERLRLPFQAVRSTPDSGAVPGREGAAVLWNRWRLLEDRQLYDLATDPLQERNVIERHPDVVAAMRAHLDAWWDGVKARANDFDTSVRTMLEQASP